MASFIAEAHVESNATTITISVPTGTLDGHLMILAVSETSTWAVSDAVSQGWTVITGAPFDRRGTSTANHMAVYYKWAASEPASYTFNGTGVGTFGQGFIGTYDVGDVTTLASEVDNTTGSGTDTVSTSTTASADPNAFDEVIVYVYGGQGFHSVLTITPDAAVNDRYKAANAAGPSNQEFLGLADEDFTVAANYPSRTFSCKWSSADFNGVQIVRLTGINKDKGNDHWGFAEPASDSWAVV